MLGHELRNPLSAIAAGVALIDRADIGPEAARRARDVIRRQSRLLTHIVDELLDASRVMTGKVTLSKQRLDLGETAYACLSALHAPGLSARYVTDRWSCRPGSCRVSAVDRPLSAKNRRSTSALQPSICKTSTFLAHFPQPGFRWKNSLVSSSLRFLMSRKKCLQKSGCNSG